MLRRAGAFRYSYYMPAVSVDVHDQGDALRQKWLRWVEYESFKRYVLSSRQDNLSLAHPLTSS